ncbi:MAG: HNH endonuclease [Leptothrix sp. (in: b-proteobacteria)]
MRRIGPRAELPASTVERLAQETSAIQRAADQKKEAEARYSKARRPQEWLVPVLNTLRAMSGNGGRCMYCSGSEASQVEHYRPKSSYPALTFDWSNLLWACGQCNQLKGNQFNETKIPVNPVDENVWQHFFIDQFGNLRSRWHEALDDLDPRAEETMRMLALDRQALQESRLARLKDLRQKAHQAISDLETGQASTSDIELKLLEWFQQPFQPDVADYFLDGPGADDATEPFKQLFELMNASDT